MISESSIEPVTDQNLDAHRSLIDENNSIAEVNLVAGNGLVARNNLTVVENFLPADNYPNSSGEAGRNLEPITCMLETTNNTMSIKTKEITLSERDLIMLGSISTSKKHKNFLVKVTERALKRNERITKWILSLPRAIFTLFKRLKK